MHFFKMAGTGNDFIVIDHRQKHFDSGNASWIASLCARRTGVGADGLILVESAASAEADVRMHYFNADGHRASMCGNGARCTARLAHHLGMVTGNRFTLLSDEGLHPVTVFENRVALTMTAPTGLNLTPGVLENPRWREGGLIDTGVPHYVIFVDDVSGLDIEQIAPPYRRHPAFPEGANVNFVSKTGSGLSVRTFERGVEGETLSCGTGCVASALLAARAGLVQSPVSIETPGGQLEVQFDAHWSRVILAGPARIIYSGQIG